MNIQQTYYTHTVVLQNLLDRIIPTRGKEEVYSLKGAITQAERNTIVVGLREVKRRLIFLQLGKEAAEAGEEGGETQCLK